MHISDRPTFIPNENAFSEKSSLKGKEKIKASISQTSQSKKARACSAWFVIFAQQTSSSRSAATQIFRPSAPLPPSSVTSVVFAATPNNGVVNQLA
ncbi:hypothetical protein DICVIV_13434 [Dictyocaulus viviparus]|uniref:Uncharacterized protein n=1 Tax=Dictyocaulus viviparus TaxID=29172 RepID=A0A0D8XAD8_DICVI|nr:hypothetical protein DICVIV_13434 [Dictyocaulus viviparus]